MDCKALILSLVMGGFCLNASAQKVVFDFGGKVTDPSGKGISGVVVNDGIHFTKTDAQGAWSLVSDTTLSKFVVYQCRHLVFCLSKTGWQTTIIYLYARWRKRAGSMILCWKSETRRKRAFITLPYQILRYVTPTR